MWPKSNIWSVERTWYRDAPEESHEGFEEAGFQRKQSHYQQMQDVSCIYFITVTTPWILSFQIRHQDPWNSIYISSFQNLLETNIIIPILIKSMFNISKRHIFGIQFCLSHNLLGLLIMVRILKYEGWRNLEEIYFSQCAQIRWKACCIYTIKKRSFFFFLLMKWQFFFSKILLNLQMNFMFHQCHCILFLGPITTKAVQRNYKSVL